MRSIQIIKCDEGKIIITLNNIREEPKDQLYYDTVDEARIEIKSGNYSVLGNLWISIKDIKLFYNELVEVHKRCKGVASLINYEGTLELKVEYKSRGIIEVKGFFKEYHHIDNELVFNIESDQTYINELIDTLKTIFD